MTSGSIRRPARARRQDHHRGLRGSSPTRIPTTPATTTSSGSRSRRRGNTGRWIEMIAHEATHAFHLATRTSAPPSNLADRVTRGASPRKSRRGRIEALVLAEIQQDGRREPASSRVRAEHRAARHGTTWSAISSRARLRRTYLEHFMLSELAQEAIKRERLSDEAAQGEERRSCSSPDQRLAVAEILVRLRQVSFLASRHPLPLGAAARDSWIEPHCLPARQGDSSARARERVLRRRCWATRRDR